MFRFPCLISLYYLIVMQNFSLISVVILLLFRMNLFLPDVPIVKITALPSTSLNEMDRVTLVCTFDSNPKPKFIVWSKNGEIISYADTYEIINLSRDDNGLYECNISNDIGYDVDSLQINVLCKLYSSPILTCLYIYIAYAYPQVTPL